MKEHPPDRVPAPEPLKEGELVVFKESLPADVRAECARKWGPISKVLCRGADEGTVLIGPPKAPQGRGEAYLSDGKLNQYFWARFKPMAVGEVHLSRYENTG